MLAVQKRKEGNENSKGWKGVEGKGRVHGGFPQWAPAETSRDGDEGVKLGFTACQHRRLPTHLLLPPLPPRPRCTRLHCLVLQRLPQTVRGKAEQRA